MPTYARNLPTEGCPLPDPPPPPPPDIRALQEAARAADAAFTALCLDATASLDDTMRAWDRAAAAESAYFRALTAQRRVAKWQGARPR